MRTAASSSTGTRRPGQARTRRAHGFTLFELLVAVTVFMLLAATAYAGLRTSATSWERVQERIDRSRVGDAVIVVVTNQRIIAYGVGSGSRAVPRIAGERVERVEAEDYAGLVVSNRRFLNFNGESGVWGERDRRVGK